MFCYIMSFTCDAAQYAERFLSAIWLMASMPRLYSPYSLSRHSHRFSLVMRYGSSHSQNSPNDRCRASKCILRMFMIGLNFPPSALMRLEGKM